MPKPKAKPELMRRLNKVAKEVESWPAWKRSVDHKELDAETKER